MGVKTPNRRIKYAVYLRFDTETVMDRVRIEGQTDSSVLCAIISAYNRVSRFRPGAIAQVRSYIKRNNLSFTEGGYSSKKQIYLLPEESDCLEKYAKEQVEGNVSLAINKIVCEYAAIAIVCPQVLKDCS